MPASKFSRSFFVRQGSRGGKAVDPRARSLASKKVAEDRLRKWCAQEGHDYDTLPTEEVTGRKLLPDAVRNKYLHWRYGGNLSANGWKPKRRKKKK